MIYVLFPLNGTKFSRWDPANHETDPTGHEKDPENTVLTKYLKKVLDNHTVIML